MFSYTLSMITFRHNLKLLQKVIVLKVRQKILYEFCKKTYESTVSIIQLYNLAKLRK